MNTKVIYFSSATEKEFPPNTVPMHPDLLPEELSLRKKSCMIFLLVLPALPHAEGSGAQGTRQALAIFFHAEHSREMTSKK